MGSRDFIINRETSLIILTQHRIKMTKMMQTLILAASVICAINSLHLEKRALSRADDGEEERDANYRAREIATHLIGEIIGEVVGENVDELVEMLVGRELGVEVEEERNPDPLHGVGKGIGK